MPIGPNNIGVVRHDLIQRATYEIDAILQDPKKSKESGRGDADDYFYTFIMPGHLSIAEKAEIIGLYKLVGWGLVEVKNSTEVNPGQLKSGLFYVKLFLKPDSKFLRA